MMSEIIDTKTYICSREKFLEMKEIQKKIAIQIHSDRSIDKQFYIKRRQYFNTIGVIVPSGQYTPYQYNTETVDLYKKYGFTETKHYDKIIEVSNVPWDNEARYFNVIYGLIKGRKYSEIEPTVREGKELEPYKMKLYCKKYDIDFTQIQFEMGWLAWQK
jgi:hypothetical protein